MAISLKSRKMLWGRSANRCAFTNCRIELVIDASETDDASVVGEECHIVAESSAGPRGDSPLTTEQRNTYSNLILMCAVHHKVIDDLVEEYSVERLHKLKEVHESWVKSSLESFDIARQRDEEQYADIIQEFGSRVDIDHWQQWSSWLLGGGHPRMLSDTHESLKELGSWILSRVWPRRYTALEDSFQNFRLVLTDFLNVFEEHSERVSSTLFATRKFYQIADWDPSRYEYLSKQYDMHVDLVQDLLLELTRAANYLCDKIRESIFSSFRLREGVLLVSYGPNIDLSYTLLRCEYSHAERSGIPYPGLKEFKSLRKSRDFSFGDDTGDSTS